MLVLAVMVHMLKYAPMESCHSWRSPALVGTLPLVGLHGQMGLGRRVIYTRHDPHDAGPLWVSDDGLRSPTPCPGLLGARVMLLTQPGSTSNVTGTSSTSWPCASCTSTITAVTCGNCRATALHRAKPDHRVSDLQGKDIPGAGRGSHPGGAQARPPMVSRPHTRINARRRAIVCSFKRGSSAARTRVPPGS